VGIGSVAKAAETQMITLAVKSADELLGQVRTLAGSFGPARAKPVLDALDMPLGRGSFQGNRSFQASGRHIRDAPAT